MLPQATIPGTLPQWPKDEKLEVFIRESKYQGQLPCFYEPEAFPELAPLVENWQAIRDEIFSYENGRGHISGLNTYSPPELSSEVSWSNIYLENFRWRFHKNRKKFPFICSVVNQIPNCTLAAISVLSPDSVIKPHYGDTNGIIRCHLGLAIPDVYPVCGIRVGAEERGWKNGEIVLFTEAHLHSTWNRSPQRRYLLVVDIIPGFIPESKNVLCAHVLGAQTYNYLEERIPVLRRIPLRVLPSVRALFALAWRMYLPIQRRLRFL